MLLCHCFRRFLPLVWPLLVLGGFPKMCQSDSTRQQIAKKNCQLSTPWSLNRPSPTQRHGCWMIFGKFHKFRGTFHILTRSTDSSIRSFLFLFISLLFERLTRRSFAIILRSGRGDMRMQAIWNGAQSSLVYTFTLGCFSYCLPLKRITREQYSIQRSPLTVTPSGHGLSVTVTRLSL